MLGTGSANYLPKFTGASTIGDSAITDNGTTVTLVSRALSGTSATFSSSVQADFLVVGTTAATSGGLRLGTQVAIRARNVANTANIPLIESTASDGVSVSNGALILASTGAATFSSTVTATGNINANNISTTSRTMTGSPVSTGLSINGYSGGKTYLLLTSQQWDAGNATSSAITMIRSGYDGNNFTACVLSSSNLPTETWSQSGGILHVTGLNNYQMDLTVLNNG
jgi:hypothetical protein